MNKLSNLLSEMSILTEANEDDLFDIDKEVDAQIKRVSNRVEKKRQEEAMATQEDQQDQEISNSEEQYDDSISDENTDDIEDNYDVSQDQTEDNISQDDSQEQSDDYEYMDNSESEETISDDYEAKQTIPELKILSTLSDSEYSLCNIKIIEQFRELQDNVESTINNILMNITTKNDRQVQVVEIVHQNLYDMIQDINTYILYRNNDIYEENVRTYLTYLKRYDIAMKLIKNILDENSKSKNDI